MLIIAITTISSINVNADILILFKAVLSSILYPTVLVGV